MAPPEAEESALPVAVSPPLTTHTTNVLLNRSGHDTATDYSRNDTTLEEEDDDKSISQSSISHSHSTSNQTTADHKDSSHSASQQLQVAQTETAAILRLRVLIFLALLISALTVCIIVYVVGRNAQESEYSKQYRAASKVVVDAFLDIMDSKMGAIANLGVTLVRAIYKNRGVSCLFVCVLVCLSVCVYVCVKDWTSVA